MVGGSAGVCALTQSVSPANATSQWLPWREQLRVRRVCRAWRSVIQQCVTTVSCELEGIALAPLRALLCCNLQVLEVRFVPSSHELMAALPATLRRLSWPLARPAAMRHLTLLEDLTLGRVSGDPDVRALGSLQTLTRLKVQILSCTAEAASLVAASLTRLCTLCTSGVGRESVFEEVMLLHGPASLTRVEFDNDLHHTVERVLQHTPLKLRALSLSHLIPLPLERWPDLSELDVGTCYNDDLVRALLDGLALRTSLRVLSMSLRATASVAPALGALVTLQELRLEDADDHAPQMDAIVAQLLRLVHLTTLTLTRHLLARGRVQSLAALPALRTLKMWFCDGDGLRGELVALTQLQCLELHMCGDWDAHNLPVQLEVFACSHHRGPLAPLGRLTALRRLCLEECDIGPAVLSWDAMVRLKEVMLWAVQETPHTLLFDLEAALPALRRVELRWCTGLDPLALTSRVVVEEH